MLEDTKNVRFIGKAWDLKAFTASADETSFKASPGKPQNYLGLLLDHRTSKEILGEVTEYFESRERMLNAVESLYKHHPGNRIMIVLLGSASPSKLPVVNYVGMVLASFRGRENPLLWVSVGLIRWIEIYTDEDFEPRYSLPAQSDLDAIFA